MRGAYARACIVLYVHIRYYIVHTHFFVLRILLNSAFLSRYLFVLINCVFACVLAICAACRSALVNLIVNFRIAVIAFVIIDKIFTGLILKSEIVCVAH